MALSFARLAIVAGLVLVASSSAWSQLPDTQIGEGVPRDVRELYDRGLKYLVSTQDENGGWSEGQAGPGQTGLCVMAFLASGEDPNFGMYNVNIRKGLQAIIRDQDPNTGFYGYSMYHHGFATLALAEAYGAVDDRNFATQGDPRMRSVGASLELAVRAAITSQKKNPMGAWRYSPDSRDADTSVAGAVLMGLLAARNAGIEVPDESIDRAIAYFKSMTADSGMVAYSGGLGGFGDSMARSSIACLVYSVARRQDLPQLEQTLHHLVSNLESPPNQYVEYTRYYQAQALFQGDIEAWEKWNKLLIRQLKSTQDADGCIAGDHGKVLGTSMSLLAVALNYRFLPIYER
jgi:hypothetical protein